MQINKQLIKKVSYPHEHGSWGFFLEPIVLSLLVAFSFNGFMIGIVSFLLFLGHKSVTIILKKNPVKAVGLAYVILSIYIASSIILTLYVISNASELTFLIPYILSIVMMIVYKAMEVLNFNRILVIELLAPISVVLIAISILLLVNWNLIDILGLSFILIARSIQTVFYIKSKLLFIKNKDFNKSSILVTDILFLVILVYFSLVQIISYLAILAFLILVIRAYIGLKPNMKSEKVKIIGIKEFVYGLLYVIINAAGYLYYL